MKKVMGKLDLGFADPKEIVKKILNGEIPTPVCIFCGKIEDGTLVVFTTPTLQYAFSSVCKNCISVDLIQAKIDVIEKRVSQIYFEGITVRLDEEIFENKMMSREIGEA